MGCGQAESVACRTSHEPEAELSGVRRPGAVWLTGQRLLALALLVLSFPVLGVLYALVRCSSRGPFLHARVYRGLRGRPFRMLVIRTTKVGATRETIHGAVWADPGMTRVGRVLRKLELDELPQLWNVVRGEMALVGPRPIGVELYDYLRAEIPGFSARSAVLPGLTGMAQLCARESPKPEELLADWKERFRQEAEENDRRSFAYDMIVLVKTMFHVIGRFVWALSGAPERGEHDSRGGGRCGATLVLGTPIANLNYWQVVDRIAAWVREGSRRYIGVCPAFSLVQAVWQKSHRQSLEGASLNTADGVPVMWAQRLFGHYGATRVCGPMLMLRVLERAEKEAWRVVFYGGEQKRLWELVSRMRRRFPKLIIADAICPPFRPLSNEENEQMTERLNRVRPDVILVALGCPKQEQWMREHTRRVPGVMIGVGAAFDFHAGALARAPMILQKMGLEWLFRLWCEPRRLLRRYVTTNPAFIAYVMAQLFWKLARRRSYQVSVEWGEGNAPQVEVQLVRRESARRGEQRPSKVEQEVAA